MGGVREEASRRGIDMQKSAIYVSHYYLRFKHLRGHIVSTPEGTRYLSGGRVFTKDEVNELMLGSAELLPHEMLVGHTLATAAYIAYHHSFSDYDASVGVLDYHGELSRQLLRRGALHHVIRGRTVPLRADRANLHLISYSVN